ncbi:vault protein inter-alpha-trypsin domain-containing protein [Mycena pura]|uniref:Vault protein inter-alpha-trypsin domain-containing protein n=1 Tax=Mycena pura TaxID=153505 RepID=A0AAD7E0R7_9AGAR|nr:vault protein inter-alpha-trypsin domain-containing protein [Mycena pura]
MFTTPIFGLYYYYEQRLVSLPLLNVRAEASIKELAAQVQLTQTYANDATFPIEAKYSFPIPARAAVCSFVMIKQDGSRVVGIVQEKQEARETYNTAVAQGQQASLMEQQTPDVFLVSVGNIPPNEQVKIELVYATELSEDEESDSIRFHLPVHIGARYGNSPQSPPSLFRNVFISASSPTPFLNISMSIEAQAPISKIGSPSHTVSTELGPDPKLPNFKELPFSNYARVSLSSDSALDKDFVLTVKSAGLDAPRCIAELHPVDDTVAMGLTLVPRFKLPDVSRQEFVLLVDRSGSMGGKRIEAAKKALIVMLRAIPHQDSLFQIVSFGSRCTALWPDGSRPYNQETLEQATRHVDSMRADYGGTEIRAALRQCFQTRKLDRPMSVLVLTDGDAWDLEGVLSECKGAVATAPEKAYLRVSVLGIGNSASTAMCEGIARVGNGTCMMVGEEETSFTGKIARMLKATKAPLISNITVDWGSPAAAALQEKAKVSISTEDDDDFEIVPQAPEKKKLNIFDESIDDAMAVDTTQAPPPPAVVLSPPPAVQQSPFKIRNLLPNIRLNVYAILRGKTIPKTVTICGTTVDGAEIELPVPVTLSHLQNTPGAPPAIHALAARKIIQDLEDGQHDTAIVKTLANADDADLLARTVKASIVRLGKTYSISSSHTSFVAVDETKPEASAEPVVLLVAPQQRPPFHGASFALSALAQPVAAFGPPPVPQAYIASPMQQQMLARPAAMSFGSSSAVGSRGRGGASPFVSASMAPQGHAAPAFDSFGPPRPAPTSPVATFDSFGVPATSASIFGGPPRPAPTSPVAKSKRKASTAFASPAPSADPLEALARLQAFDGCFSLEVLSVVKLSTDVQTVRAVFPAGAPDAVVATVIAMAFLANKLGTAVERDAWEGMYEKAQQYVEAALQTIGATESVEALEAKVAKLLV